MHRSKKLLQFQVKYTQNHNKVHPNQIADNYWQKVSLETKKAHYVQRNLYGIAHYQKQCIPKVNEQF